MNMENILLNKNFVEEPMILRPPSNICDVNKTHFRDI